MTLDEEIAATQKKLDALLLRKKERFTPGPWYVNGFDRSIYSMECGQSSVTPICGNVRSSSDARLIREAPEMYAIVELVASGRPYGMKDEAAEIVRRVNG